jgi:hypothetical protein
MTLPHPDRCPVRNLRERCQKANEMADRPDSQGNSNERERERERGERERERREREKRERETQGRKLTGLVLRGSGNRSISSTCRKSAVLTAERG